MKMMKTKTRQLILPFLAAGVLVSLAGWSNAQEESGETQLDLEVAAGAFNEGDNLEVSVSELQQMLNSPSGLTESGYDPENPPNLFDNDARILEIFKGKPKFVYLPEGTDPMIIPWIRIRIIAEEMFADAKLFAANRDYDQSIAKLNEIREKYPNTPTADMIPQELERVEKLRFAALNNTNPQVVTRKNDDDPVKAPELPTWVYDNTTAIMMGPEPVVVIGNDFLHVGDQVPRYAAVTVKSISESAVIFEFQDKEFQYEVLGSF